MVTEELIDEWLDNAGEDIISLIEDKDNSHRSREDAYGLIKTRLYYPNSGCDIVEHVRKLGGNENMIEYSKEARIRKEKELRGNVDKYLDD